MINSIIENWSDRKTEIFGKQTVLFNHRLKDTGLFTHEALAELIEKCPSDHYNITTMGYDPFNPEWREGVVGDASGADTIRAIKNGRMWLNMRKVSEIDARYDKVLNKIFDEFESLVPGFDTFKRQIGILVSSPKVQVFYHADVPGQSLWQVEGTKKVYIYPPRDPYLSKESLEGIILGRTEEEIPYNKSFDKHAEIFDLEPGQALHWPLNGPHRIENADCLNISVTTEHWTKEIRNSYAVNYANGILRRGLGMKTMAAQPKGLHVYPKAAFALVHKKMNLGKSTKVVRKVDFKVNPSAPKGIMDIPAYAK